MSINPIISVIVPVYNVQEYIKECLDSIVAQTLGFRNIQVILINDGSTDASGAVCREFFEKYSENVIYIEQDNSGVASARNRGIELAEGILTTFLDADDKWSSDAFELAYNSYLQHNDVSVISCRMCFFDSKNGEHQLNYKYKSNRVADVRLEYNVPQLSSSSVFIATKTVKKYKYLTGQKYSEDFRFINEILLDHCNMVLLNKPIYWYRKREDNNSAMQKSLNDSEYYIQTCRNVYNYLFDLSKKKYGHVLRYLQFCVMYDLRWRLKVPLQDTCLTESEKTEYTDIIKSLLYEIDDDIILEQKRIALALQLYALELKHNEPYKKSLNIDENGRIRYLDYPVFDLSRQSMLHLKSVFCESGHLIVSGQVNLPFDEDCFKLSYSVNGTRKNLLLSKTASNIKTYLNGILKSNLGVKVSEPVGYSSKLELVFYIRFNDSEYLIRPKFNTSTSLDKKNGILIIGHMLLYRTETSVIIAPNSPATRLMLFLKRCLHL